MWSKRRGEAKRMRNGYSYHLKMQTSCESTLGLVVAAFKDLSLYVPYCV